MTEVDLVSRTRTVCVQEIHDRQDEIALIKTTARGATINVNSDG